MTRTKLEKEIRHKRTRKGQLVPLLEDLFKSPVEIESEEDVEWIEQLLRRMVERQHDRNFKPLYSPSQLSSCLRHVYLLKHRRELGIPFNRSTSTSAHFYFFNGNFLHLKWQFALHKLEEAVNDPGIFMLHGVEVPIRSKRKDHGGTVDALASLYGEPVIIDFKGLNVRAFQEITRGFIPLSYGLQLSDYGMLLNSAAKKNGNLKISRALLVSENKGGAVPKHPLALHEHSVQIETHLPEVKSRLKTLRTHSEEGTIPEPECQSTGIVQFKSCPFRKFCKEEVRAIERANRAKTHKEHEGMQVATPASGKKRRSNRRVRRS